MPQIYVAKYNRFVDAVLNRINRLLGKQYDPVRVKLLSQIQRTNTKVKKNSGNTKKKGTSAQKTNKMGEYVLPRSQNEKYEIVNNSSAPTHESESQTEEPEFVLISKVGSTSSNTTEKPQVAEQPPTVKQPQAADQQTRAAPVRQNNKKRVTVNNTTKKTTTNKKKNTSTNVNNNKKKAGTKTKPTTNKTKQSNNKNKQKAKATLFGLSTLKRDGDVTVNTLPDYTTVKTNFVLGPLRLRVEREVARSGKRQLRSATATTAEMYGRLNLRLMHGGAAVLQSIRVLQPKQVRIDTADNHDKTTEFMWKRSPQIASIVSQKLGAVARSLLKPQPQPRP